MKTINLTLLFLKITLAVKFVDNKNNCFNLKQGKKFLTLKKTDCKNHSELLVDANKNIILEDACVTLKTPLFLERINCNQPNTLKFDSLVGFYTNQNGNEIYLEQRGRRFFIKLVQNSNDSQNLIKIFNNLNSKIQQNSNNTCTASKLVEIGNELIQNSKDSANEIKTEMKKEQENCNQEFKNLETKMIQNSYETATKLENLETKINNLTNFTINYVDSKLDIVQTVVEKMNKMLVYLTENMMIHHSSSNLEHSDLEYADDVRPGLA